MYDEKDKDYLYSLNNSIKKQRFQIYNYINFLSCKTDDYKENYLNYKYNIPIKNENKNINIDEEEIQKRNENFLKFIENELNKSYKDLENMNEYIKNSKKYILNINIRNEQEVIKYYSSIKKKTLKTCQNKETIFRSDFVSLIFKNMINKKEDSIVRDSVKSDRRTNYFPRNKINKLPRQNSDNERNYDINDYFREYIKNNFKDSKIEIKINNTSPIKNNSKFRILPQNRIQQINSMYYNTSQSHINIKNIPFNIILSFNLNKELIYNNHKFLISLKDEYDSPSHSELILYKKIKCLLYERILSILNLIYEEKRRKMNNTNSNIILFDEEILREFLIKFINYVYDFNMINKTKCHLCQNIVKFSSSEKCFLPPFYKAYKEKEALTMNSKNENENEPKLFYHEDCFRRIAGSFL